MTAKMPSGIRGSVAVSNAGGGGGDGQQFYCAGQGRSRCMAPACSPQIRGILGTGMEAGDGVWANMLAWINAVDFDAVPFCQGLPDGSPAPWGNEISYLFNTPDDTEPLTPEENIGSGLPVGIGGNQPSSMYLIKNNDGSPFFSPTILRMQAQWPICTYYGVYSLDFANGSGGKVLLTEIAFGQTANNAGIFELPSAQSSTTTAGVQPVYLAVPLLTKDLFAQYFSEIYGPTGWMTGPAWDPTKVAFPSGTDPFTGTAP